MKTATIGKILLALFLSVAFSQMAFAEQKSITLPKGTTVQKLGPGHFKFILPGKRIVEVQKFDPKTGVIGLVSIVDPDPPTKPVVSGKQGKLVVTRKLTKAEAGKLPPTDYVMIDDDVSWLPATIQFQVVVSQIEKSITLPKGTTVQKVGPGHFKFFLPDKRIVEVRNLDQKAGTIGLVSIINPDPPGHYKLVASGNQGELIVTRKLTRAEVGKLSASDYVMIDDDVTWLPSTIKFMVESDGGLSPQPDPPGKRH